MNSPSNDPHLGSYAVQMVPATPPVQPEEPAGTTIDLRVLLSIFWNGKWIVLISILSALLLGFLVISQMQPRYRAAAQVMFDIQRSNVVDLDAVVSSSGFDDEKLQDQIYVLQSTTLIERVIDALNLDRRGEFNPALAEPKETVLDRINEVANVSGTVMGVLQDFGVVSPPPPPMDEAEKARQERLTVIENVRENLRLRSLGRSRVIEVSFTSLNPNTAARVANAVTEQYIVDQLEAKLEATRAATSWLSVRVDELRTRVEVDENAVETARAAISEASGQTLEVTQQQLQSLNGALANVRSDITRLSSLFDRLNLAVDEGADLGAITDFRSSPIIQRYRDQEDTLLAQQTVLGQSVPQDHPARVRIRQQLSDVRVNMDAEAARIVSSVGIDLKSAQAQEEALLVEVQELEETAMEQSRNGVQLRQLDREAEASRVLYENFLARLQETTQQEDLQAADARVLSPAETPLTAASGRKRIILIAAAIVGAIGGIGIVFLLDRLNNTFRAPGQLEDITGERVLAVLPSLTNRSARIDIIRHLREKPGASLAEAVRNLRTSILFSNVDKPPKVVMFTSSVPREGKSTTSTMVALTSRQMGKSAIIVDCDLRLPVLAKLIDSDNPGPDLMDVLEGTADPVEAIYEDPETGLHMLMKRDGSERGSINAADILSSRRFKELIDALAKSYDMVILDTPPAVVVTDARILSQIADTVVYAVRWDATPRGAVSEGLKELRSVNAPIAGLVMTMVNEAKASRYSYDGYGYYKGRYSDYYTQS